ncbi:mitochondrial 54S ribosomal protein uL6m [Limtongia smithiae]|uniref:mitochondrial 54S ribosomal protein uL6m n=1 Tax=Limtongia smithiae TaxID=1125753 RepID=UPI0034CE4705
MVVLYASPRRLLAVTRLLSTRSAYRCMHACSAALSHVGSSPIFVPSNVKLFLDVYNATGDTSDVPLVISGPKGTGSVNVPSFARLELKDEGTKLFVTVEDRTQPKQRQMWGLIRSLIQNHVTGVTDGHVVLIHLSGTGYRTELLAGERKISVKVGQTGVTIFELPEGITAKSPNPTRLLLEGPDKNIVTQFAHTIRALKPPEPYKGKGIYVNNETVKRKNKSVK